MPVRLALGVYPTEALLQKYKPRPGVNVILIYVMSDTQIEFCFSV